MELVIPFPDSRIHVHGLGWYAETRPFLWRFPQRFHSVLPEGLFEAGKQTAGVRLRFRTDSGHLSLRASFPSEPYPHPNMTRYTAQGIATYVDGQCWSSVIPSEGGKGEVEVVLFHQAPRREKEVCLYLPLYGSIDIHELILDADASLAPPRPYAHPLPVVFYGTSITQGGCASRPGLSYQAMLSRQLNIDYINMGFSGRGKCESQVALILAELRTSCFVLDVGQNNTPEELEQRIGPFIDILREAQPKTPLLITIPIFYNAELWSSEYAQESEKKREIIRNAVLQRKQAGDTRIFLLEKDHYLGEWFTDGSVDGGHPNDLGFFYMAKGMASLLSQILDLPQKRSA